MSTRTAEVTIATGQDLTRGAVLGVITASGQYKLTAVASSDGSQLGTAILAVDIDTSTGAATGIVYTKGEFNEDKLNFGASTDADDVRTALRDFGIYLKNAVDM
jgi:hypothetical protein